jgi:hypothetical protein
MTLKQRLIAFIASQFNLDDVFKAVLPYLLAYAQKKAEGLGKTIRGYAPILHKEALEHVDKVIDNFSETTAGKVTTLDEEAKAAWHDFMNDDSLLAIRIANAQIKLKELQDYNNAQSLDRDQIQDMMEIVAETSNALAGKASAKP